MIELPINEKVEISVKGKGEAIAQVIRRFNLPQTENGEEIDIDIETEGEAKVGIAIVDKSVFILTENRLNLKQGQVFDELERQCMLPQVELHEISLYPSITTKDFPKNLTEAKISPQGFQRNNLWPE